MRRFIGRQAARAAALFCAAFAAFQVALALGAPYGDIAWGGSSPRLPPALRAASAGAALYLLLMAAVMLARAGDVWRRGPPRLLFGVNLFLSLQLALNTAANLASASPGERTVMGAASAVGCALAAAALLAPLRR